MKRIFYLISVCSFFFLQSCEKECVNNPGKISEREFTLDTFIQLIVYQGIELHLLNDDTQKIKVVAGSNQWENLHLTVKENTLELRVDTPCLIGENPVVKVYISNPNLQIIRHSGEKTIYSDETLTHSRLILISENYQSDYANYGNFNISVDTSSIEIVSNGISNFLISGKTQNLHLDYYAGIGKFNGKNLIANHVTVYHRGENSLEIFPLESLEGDIMSVGDVISYHQPDAINIKLHYTGKLIFK